jgi:hypothetical protein
MVGYCLGCFAKGPKIKDRVEPQQDNPIYLKLFKLTALISALGMILILLDLLRSGASIDNTLYNTNNVRSSIKTGILTTCATGMYGFQLVCVCLYLYLLARKIKIHMIWHVIMTIVICGRFAQAFLSVNRQITYIAFAWYIFYIFLTPGRLNVKDLGKKMIPLVPVVLVCVAYILFISYARNDKSYLDKSLQQTQIRYNISNNTVNSKMGGGVLFLDYYPSHVFTMIDQILESAPAINFDLYPVFAWPYNAADKLLGTNLVIFEGYHYRSFMDSNGVYTMLWPSIFGDGAYCFGYIFIFPLIFVISFLYGFAIRIYATSGNLCALFIAFLIYNYAIMGHMMIVGDVIMNVSLLVGAMLIVYELVIRQRRFGTNGQAAAISA